MKIRVTFSLLLLLGSLPVESFAQFPLVDALNPLNPADSSLRITDVTVSSSFLTESAPYSAGSLSSAGRPARLSADMLQTSATFGWSRTRDKSNISITYTPAYLREFPLATYHSFNQSLGITASRSLASKWTLSASLHGLVDDFNQLLFASSAYGNLAEIPSTFSELVSGILTGQSTNPGVSQLLSLAPVNSSPETAFVYGGREFSASASASLLYTRSTRSSFRFSAQGMRTQYLNAGGGPSTIGPGTLIPATTIGSVGLGWTYSLTPRTTFTADVSASRSVSRYQDAYATQITGSVGHTLNTHWFVQATGGVGYINPVRETFAIRQSAEPQFGGTIGYKFGAQTLLASYSRTASDSYGLGAYSTEGSSGAWTWNRPGSNMSLSGGFGYSHLTGPILSNTSSWTGHANVSRKIQSQLFIILTYSYVRYPAALVLGTGNLVLSGEMVGLSWSPSPVRR